MDQPKYTEIVTENPSEKASAHSSFSIRAVLFSVLKRPWIPILTILLITVPAAFYFLNSIRLYRSQAQVMLPVRENTYAITNFISDGGEPAKPSHYFSAILTSDNYLNAVQAEMRRQYPDKPVGNVQSQLGFNTSRNEPGIFTLYSVTPHEQMAQPLVKVAVEEFRNRITSLDQQEARAVLDFINEQLDDLNQKTIRAEEELQNFLRENQFVIENPDLGVAQSITQLENQLSEAETHLRLINLDIESTNSQIESMLEGGTEATLSKRDRRRDVLEQEQQKLENEISAARDAGAPAEVIDSLATEKRIVAAELLRTMSSYSPEGESQSVTLGNLQAILEELTIERKRAKNRVDFYQAKLENFRTQHPNISQDILTYTQLQRQRDVLNQTLAILLEKKEETRIRMASQLGGVKVLEDPIKAEPLARNTIQKLLLVFIISVVMGVALAFITDLMRNTVDAEPDVTQNFDFPLLGVVPRLNPQETSGKREGAAANLPAESNLITNFSTHSWFTEAMRSIRTSLLFQASETNAQVFAVTSPMPSEGKTLSVGNMAILIQHSGKKVVVIDADLRRPKQHRQFGLPRKPGLTDYLLSDNVSIEEILQPSHQKDLYLIAAGGSSHDPAELVASRKMRNLVEQLRERFDYIFIDTPPVLPAVDSRVIGEYVDGLVIIARAEVTKMRSLQSAVDLLQSLNIRVIGAILNHADRKYNKLYYYSYGRYHSYYSYYYRPYTYYSTTYGNDKSGEPEEQEQVDKTV